MCYQCLYAIRNVGTSLGVQNQRCRCTGHSNSVALYSSLSWWHWVLAENAVCTFHEALLLFVCLFLITICIFWGCVCVRLTDEAAFIQALWWNGALKQYFRGLVQHLFLACLCRDPVWPVQRSVLTEEYVKLLILLNRNLYIHIYIWTYNEAHLNVQGERYYWK